MPAVIAYAVLTFSHPLFDPVVAMPLKHRVAQHVLSPMTQQHRMGMRQMSSS